MNNHIFVGRKRRQAAKAVASHAKALDDVVAVGKKNAIDVTPITTKPPPAPKPAAAAAAAPPPPPAPARAPAPVRATPAPAPAPAAAPQPIDRELQNLWAFRMWEAAGRCVLVLHPNPNLSPEALSLSPTP